MSRNSILFFPENAFLKYRIFSSGTSINTLDLHNIKKLYPNSGFFVSRAKKQLFTTLRAPKHFKVGRHHFHTTKRLLTIKIPLQKRTPYLYLSPSCMVSLCVSISNLSYKHPVSELTSTSLFFKCITRLV